MLDCCMIEPCQSNWASPVVLVTKKECSTRFCLNYQKDNGVTCTPINSLEQTTPLMSSRTHSTLVLKTVQDWPTPHTVKIVHVFLGLDDIMNAISLILLLWHPPPLRQASPRRMPSLSGMMTGSRPSCSLKKL